NCNFVRTQLYGADLSDADFTNAKFDSPARDMLGKAKMDRTNISGCDFNEINIWKADQLATCRYAPHNPPKNIMREVTEHPTKDDRITHIHLATPFDFDMEFAL
ncbi:MAG: pentapeptide repeat-containing protein, partial [Candidatus Puniceispirillum sp.]